mmetsp:Transcript_27925/g.70051  ORF Transcript_27925/g.70051 Transcript_27925/m.70051 type:complete len:336 (-) Transcript_27925:106-1113(-)|eukprot:CAMPEP_0177649306 /NCGR_PEP_ID=MMETSP0447-20121125/11311_1 /TAXON_ID=0 /ORGANISM="Stygamoeba regulata, Strain BSH-02190019" /LENGTH=335 /DNA_ID=CAMNT_0019152045 /DNA_START=145 /DNA_END=1152 /DNA_ORIENTATION=-
MKNFFGREEPGYKNFLVGASVLFAVATLAFLIVSCATHWYVQIRPTTEFELMADPEAYWVEQLFSWNSIETRVLNDEFGAVSVASESYAKLGLHHLSEHYRVCVALIATACACAGLSALLLLLLAFLVPNPRSHRPPTGKRARLIVLLVAVCLLIATCCVVFTVTAVVYHSNQPSALRADLTELSNTTNATNSTNSTGVQCVMACSSFCDGDGEEGTQWRPDAGWAIAVCSLSLSATLVLLCAGLLYRSLRHTYHDDAVRLHDEEQLCLADELLLTSSLYQGQDLVFIALRNQPVFGDDFEREHTSAPDASRRSVPVAATTASASTPIDDDAAAV